MLNSIIQAVLSAITYYYYNKFYFRLVCNSQLLEDKKNQWIFLSFIINFSVFYVCTILEVELIINWLIFTLFIFLETYFLFGRNFNNAAFLSLQGTICGLSANVLNRCLLAIILNKELIVFANTPSASENLKSVPIIFGFISTAFVFNQYSQKKQSKQLSLLFHYPKHMMFLFKVMIVMMLCLLVHLILYNYDASDLILKLWGLSSAIFVVIGYFLGLNYTIRLSELEESKEQNKKLKVMVRSQQELEESLSKIVYLDELTGFYNRQFADQYIQELYDKKTSFCLCFVDINELKYVNDNFGHSEGDQYIFLVAKELSMICQESKNCFRYGGDEFILLFTDMKKDEVTNKMETINQNLAKVELIQDSKFQMSLSYGVVISSEQNNVSDLIAKADEIMYKQKKSLSKKVII